MTNEPKDQVLYHALQSVLRRKIELPRDRRRIRDDDIRKRRWNSPKQTPEQKRVSRRATPTMNKQFDAAFYRTRVGNRNVFRNVRKVLYRAIMNRGMSFHCYALIPSRTSKCRELMSCRYVARNVEAQSPRCNFRRNESLNSHRDFEKRVAAIPTITFLSLFDVCVAAATRTFDFHGNVTEKLARFLIYAQYATIESL